MAKVKTVNTKTAEELVVALGLSPIDWAEIEFRSELNSKIIKIVEKSGITHSELAKLAGSSRTRMKALVNRNTMDISTDLMLRVLAALGYKGKLKIFKAVWFVLSVTANITGGCA
ncbi:MAG: XRE family transcriptional regulator [Bdellovibrionales bacterium]